MKMALVSASILLVSTASFASVGDDWSLEQIPSGSMVTFTQTIVLPPANSANPVNEVLFDDLQSNDGTMSFIECDLSAMTGNSSYQVSAGHEHQQRHPDFHHASRSKIGSYELVWGR